MKRQILFLFILSALCFSAPSCSRDKEAAQMEQMLEQNVRAELSRAVDAVGMMLSQIQDVGYTSWTPASAVEKLVPLLNSASETDPAYPPAAGIADKIEYVTGKITKPYQILLTPQEESTTIRIDAYGVDLAAPMISRTIAVPKY